MLGPPDSCLSPLNIRVLPEHAEIHPITSLLSFPSCCGGCWGKAHPCSIGAAQDLVLRVWKLGCPQDPILSALRLIWALPPTPSMKTGNFWGSFSSPIPAVMALQWGWGVGGMCSLLGGSWQTQTMEKSNLEPQNIRFPRLWAAFAKICVQGRAAALLRHRKNPKQGVCAPKQAPIGLGGPGTGDMSHPAGVGAPSCLVALAPPCLCPWDASPWRGAEVGWDMMALG